jgi:hypothetical protein
MKEDAILIILEAFIDLMLPDNTTSAYEVDEVKEMCTSSAVCREHEGTF